MQSVHISQFYPCSEVENACELYYICELGKYLFYNYGECVSLDGVILNSKLKKSDIWDFFRLSLDKGWVINSGIPEDEVEVTVQFPLIADLSKVSNVLFTMDEVPFDREDYNRRSSDLLFAYCEPERFQVSFETTDEYYWLWSVNGYEGKYFNVNNKAFGHNLSHQRRVSLVAMVAVHRLKTGTPEKLVLSFGQSTVMIAITSLSYLQILEEDKRCLYGWCNIVLEDSVQNADILQMGYASWYMKGKDEGFLNRWYSPDEKLDWLKQHNLGEGDIVAVYERTKATKMNYMKQIASCHIAKIISIKGRSMTLQLFNTVKTKYHGERDFYNKTTAVRKMYMGQRLYENFNSTMVTLDFSDLGVGYLLYTEYYLLVDLNDCYDMVELWVTDGTRKDHICIPQNDAIYWILKDYGLEFNEKNFLLKNFKGKTPLYTQYMSGETLDEIFYIKEKET